jgi:hypothetical protein
MIEYEDALAEGYISEDALRFENPSFDNSIVAVDYDGRLIYDYDLMVEELMKQDDMSGEEAIDFISYNTLRSLDYMTDKKKPIVIMERIRNNGFQY